VAGFFAVEAAARERGRAASLEATRDDQDTTRGIVTACIVAACVAPLLRRIPLHPLPRAAAPMGLAVQAAGLGLRIWSMRTLGSAHSRTLRTNDVQHVVEDGPYRLIRHPGYAGTLLIWTGFALTSGSLPVIATVSGLAGRAYGRRITAEEALLRRDLPGHAKYSRRTTRLVPHIWWGDSQVKDCRRADRHHLRCDGDRQHVHLGPWTETLSDETERRVRGSLSRCGTRP
jgi:protein-S-isoprenylcysteine O-methyltransferase Ste14